MSPPRQKPNKTLVEQIFENSMTTTKDGERPESQCFAALLETEQARGGQESEALVVMFQNRPMTRPAERQEKI